MAAGTVDRYLPIENVGVSQSPALRFVTVTTGTSANAGQVTLTAQAAGLSVIKGFAGAAWGATTGTGLLICSTTTITEAGVTSVALEVLDDASNLTASITCSLLVWGE